MNFRSCHNVGEARGSGSEDSTHKRFIGANCVDCHKEMAMKVTCDACHIQQGLAFEASGRVMPPLPETVKIVATEGVDDAPNVLKVLGYKIVWRGISPETAEVIKPKNKQTEKNS